MSEWWDTSPKAQLFYHLGLNCFQPLPKIVELCSSSDDEVQETDFIYLCDNLHSQCLDYKLENFHDVEFIPAESKDGFCLKKLEEVYSCTQWKSLGFHVVKDRYQSAPMYQLGVKQHPSMSKLLDLLEKTPPPHLMKRLPSIGLKFYLITWQVHLQSFSSFPCVDIIPGFSAPDLTKLSRLLMVLMGPSSALKLLPPTQCYLDQGAKPELYVKLFDSVNFGTKVNHFLGACGSKNKVSIEDIVEALTDNPERFFQLAGGYEGWVLQGSTRATPHLLDTSFLVEL
ncbi:hypothetical protein EDC04DRAFT_2903943 [Pisolithus marmoratus]|nr:hypothetical protein EDC04DRAFT_2903943 [Pisolithus marmoratus]